jgi:hypothetical protein
MKVTDAIINPANGHDAVSLLELLHALPQDEVVTLRELSLKTKRDRGTLGKQANKLSDAYKLRLRHNLHYYGHPKAITALKKGLRHAS